MILILTSNQNSYIKWQHFSLPFLSHLQRCLRTKETQSMSKPYYLQQRLLSLSLSLSLSIYIYIYVHMCVCMCTQTGGQSHIYTEIGNCSLKFSLFRSTVAGRDLGVAIPDNLDIPNFRRRRGRWSKNCISSLFLSQAMAAPTVLCQYFPVSSLPAATAAEVIILDKSSNWQSVEN